MLAIELKKVKKYLGDRLLLAIDGLRIYRSDKIGVVGPNGAGKTTFLRMLSGKMLPDEGVINRSVEVTFIDQFEEKDMVPTDPSPSAPWKKDLVNPLLMRAFQVNDEQRETLSGGEITRQKIGRAFSQSTSHILLADEPTTNLDVEGTELLQEQLKAYDGPILLVSHDRELLDCVCNRIIEVDKGSVRLFSGNYSAYRTQKETERERQAQEYVQYVEERERLQVAVREKSRQAKEMRATPSRMGNSEARLHKRRVNNKRAKLDRGAKAIQSRLEQLEVKEKPVSLPTVCFDRIGEQKISARKVLVLREVSKSFGGRNLFQDVSFEVSSGSKVALVGPNGCGKTTLLKMIMNSETGITVPAAARVGYFDQRLSRLEEERTVLDTLRSVSAHPESVIRTLLARLLFLGDDVYKKVKVLSGGERVKLALARVLVQDFHLLILDEPTNFLDLYAMEALEALILEYPGAVLFVSHDRRFVDRLAQQLLVLEAGRIIAYNGSYSDYLSKSQEKARRLVTDQERKAGRENSSEELMCLQLRLTQVLAQLSMTPLKGSAAHRAILEAEYQQLVKKIRSLQK
ncbi:ABC-F type ribosomal protection protein [Heliobacterium chlorum]|uniref:ABC-F type ribosomal protection protein n=1 Tax=Heliobacterium chlorum TaxID=2698 RepID=A0ABR7T913_HELCL|nr:ABC-F type ribosomal protection protein [Heliobacterium chlorum]MBC9786156.1 ABC-F type ribosomal protection protein [Heliobacterium chlorum]